MKRMIACLLVLGGIAFLASGCKPKEQPSPEKAVEEAVAAEEAPDAPDAPAAPAAPAAPKDHPAH